MIEKTLCIIKPDISNDKIKEINSIITSNNFKILESRKMLLTKEQASDFYIEHKEKSFFPSLINFMTSGEITVQILSRENAIEEYRKLIGATNPALAQENTIRSKYGTCKEKNAIHGSDSKKSAQREINFFFK